MSMSMQTPMKEQRQESLKRKVAFSMKLPEESIMDLPLVKLVSNSEAIIENHRGISEFNNEVLKVITSTGIIKISGIQLHISEIDQNSIMVKGQIYLLEYI